MSIIYPLIQESGPEFTLSDADFTELEQVGKITLSTELRQRLSDLAHFWVAQLRELQSPRSKQFRKRLNQIRESLEKASEAFDLNREGTSIWEYHLFNWIRNTGVEGATTFFRDHKELLTLMKGIIGLMARSEQMLPPDGGRRRPYDDERLFMSLADIYECAGGKAAVYWSEYSSGLAENVKGSMADTPFRRFVQTFYARLPAVSKRTRVGVDEALRDAKRSRRSSAVKQATGRA